MEQLEIESVRPLHAAYHNALEPALDFLPSLVKHLYHGIHVQSRRAATHLPGLLVKLADDSSMQRRFGILTEGTLVDYGKMAAKYFAFMFRVCGCLEELYRKLKCESISPCKGRELCCVCQEAWSTSNSGFGSARCSDIARPRIQKSIA